jgi:hypothetical protein
VANLVFNAAKRRGIDVWYDAAAESPGRLRLLLIQDGSQPSDPDADTVADVLGASPTGEVSVAGYARQTLDNVTRGIDDTNDFAYLDADDVVFSGMSSGEDVAGALLYEHVTEDSDSIPIAWYEFSEVVDSLGSITVAWNTPANGAVIKGA